MSILHTLGVNAERVIGDHDRALQAYQAIAASTTATGSAEYFSGLQGAARILTGRGEHVKALAVLDLVDPQKLGGSWAGSMWLAHAQALEAAGHKSEALKAYRAAAWSKATHQAQRKEAEAAIERLSD